MCGIAGLIAPGAEPTLAALRPMVRALVHRGPDDAGEALLPFGRLSLALGHRRLSILDLSSAGHQPIVHPRTGDVLIFNGEIYNFRSLREELAGLGEQFIGHGDSEVLLHALGRWYTGALPKLRGMYAFAFYQAASQRLLLARDPAGIKPLYISQTEDRLLFASEVRAVLASGLVEPEFDRRGAAGFLAYGAVQHPFTLIRGVHSLAPGSWQDFSPSETGIRASSPRAFWDYPMPGPAPTSMDAVDTVRRLVEDAVEDHLISDVPVGVFLSSGLDSTIIAGVAARHSPALRSFTVSTAGLNETGEAPQAEETARRFGLNHQTIPLPAAELERAFLPWLEALDQPSIDGFNVYLITRAVRAEGIKVALSGLGGDELFGGYPSFRDVPRLRKLLRTVRWLPSSARRALAWLGSPRKSVSVRRKLGDMLGGNASLLSLYFQRRRAMSDGQLASLGLHAGAVGPQSRLHANGGAGGVEARRDRSRPRGVASRVAVLPGQYASARCRHQQHGPRTGTSSPVARSEAS